MGKSRGFETRPNLARVVARLSGAKHRRQDVSTQLLVVGGALTVVPHAHVHLLDGRRSGAAEVDGAPACNRAGYQL